jgi:lipopolysaccharide transport system ATP-binding protein
MSEEVLVSVQSVSKTFCRSLKRSLLYAVQDIARDLNPFWGKADSGTRKLEREKGGFVDASASDLSTLSAARLPSSAPPHSALRPDEFWAVKDVSFELRRGECLALIGRNGAGKTTLLKMLNGLIKPDHGRIEMRGRVAALIALGAGFNPILTGRENIYVNGSVLGLTKREIDAKVEDIIDFADIREFINTPVQSYSSGMQVRLGFAVATALEPDVLLLDEVLAVGDAAFRSKCYRRIVGMRKKAAVIFVSHSMEQVSRICDRALLMSRGQPLYSGDITGGVHAYETLNDAGEETTDSFLSLQPPITSFSAELPSGPLKSGDPLEMKIHLNANAPVDDFQLRLYVYNVSGGHAADLCFEAGKLGIKLLPGASHWGVVLDSIPLKNGRYTVNINLIDPHGDLLVWSYKQHAIVITGAFVAALADCQLRLGRWEPLPPTALSEDGLTSRNPSSKTPIHNNYPNEMRSDECD